MKPNVKRDKNASRCAQLKSIVKAPREHKHKLSATMGTVTMSARWFGGQWRTLWRAMSPFRKPDQEKIFVLMGPIDKVELACVFGKVPYWQKRNVDQKWHRWPVSARLLFIFGRLVVRRSLARSIEQQCRNIKKIASNGREELNPDTRIVGFWTHKATPNQTLIDLSW